MLLLILGSGSVARNFQEVHTVFQILQIKSYPKSISRGDLIKFLGLLSII